MEKYHPHFCLIVTAWPLLAPLRKLENLMLICIDAASRAGDE